MSDPYLKFSESNPFSTRFTAPGKTPFFFERAYVRQLKASHPAKFEEFFVRALGSCDDIRTSVCIQFLQDKFESNSCRGQIVGAHGSGKTTLLHALKDALIKNGYEIFSWTLHDQQKFLPDVFWLELQNFLQAPPNFLPTKCLLPPPVIAKEDYIAQQREALRDVFGGKDDKEQNKPEENLPQFCVSDSGEQTNNGDGSTGSTGACDQQVGNVGSGNVKSTSDARDVCDGYLGFNDSGNFGLNRRRPGQGSNASNFENDSEPVVFDPFPGIAPPPEETNVERDEEDEEEYDDVKIDASVVKPENEPEEQKKLEIPLPDEYDYKKGRSFFDKKIVCFDGFEQLSYVNRIIVRTFCRMNHLGLLLTTHSPAIGIPVLFRTVPSVDSLGQLMTFLLEDLDVAPEDAELETLLKNFHYDVREILFSLYDAYEKYRWAPREVREKLARKYPR